MRRFLAVFVERGEVAEWSATQARWIPLPPDANLEDPTLVRPVPIRALFDDDVADDAVLAALEGNRANDEIVAALTATRAARS